MAEPEQTRECDVNGGNDFQWPWAEQHDLGSDTMDLYTAASLGKEDCVKKCLESFQNSADVDKKNRGGWTSLMYAAYWGHEPVLKLLLMSKTNPRKKNFSGHTALMLSAMCDNVQCGKTLLQHGASTEDRDSQDWTALFHAACLGHLNFVHLLIENGAQLNICEKTENFTPLMIGASAGHELIVDALLQNGANPLGKSADGDTAKSLAEKKGYVKVVTVLESHYLQKFNK
ncbi:ankyrin repeat and SAM domain-containing protein 3-like, partial [Limulus polyphemus]|uniref:Ankyrin repeat and SAM domain-containing protein 3-like n=1 Tax=Limulus polyphemus TaxID=6850 RepID=A0ABM1BXC7_LIMPO